MTNREKTTFLKQLGYTLSLTNLGILGIKELGESFVQVMFENGYIKTVNIAGNSYLAIIDDIIHSLH